MDQLIELAIAEDIGHGDITTEPLGLGHAAGQARIVANEPLVIAGLDVARRVYEALDANISFHARVEEGAWADPQDVVAELKSDMQTLLAGERIALNFLQRISGIATHVRTYVDTLPKSGIRLTDTRKTVPGWRVLEKYAVRVGGACNHRMGLYDGVLIKDNHIAACGGIAPAVQRVRGRVSHLIRIEVETENLRQVEAALAAGADVIMLDNMMPLLSLICPALTGFSSMIPEGSNPSLSAIFTSSTSGHVKDINGHNPHSEAPRSDSEFISRPLIEGKTFGKAFLQK
ncbi:MAG: carboxylating nicotinate-nucleotide diphosphorylase [bacterium]